MKYLTNFCRFQHRAPTSIRTARSARTPLCMPRGRSSRVANLSRFPHIGEGGNGGSKLEKGCAAPQRGQRGAPPPSRVERSPSFPPARAPFRRSPSGRASPRASWSAGHASAPGSSPPQRIARAAHHRECGWGSCPAPLGRFLQRLVGKYCQAAALPRPLPARRAKKRRQHGLSIRR